MDCNKASNWSPQGVVLNRLNQSSRQTSLCKRPLQIYCLLRARRTLKITIQQCSFENQMDVLVVQSIADSALLVLNKTLNSINALLVLNRTLNSINALLVLNRTLNSINALLVLNRTLNSINALLVSTEHWIALMLFWFSTEHWIALMLFWFSTADAISKSCILALTLPPLCISKPLHCKFNIIEFKLLKMIWFCYNTYFIDPSLSILC